MKLTLIDISWSTASPVLPDAKLVTCLHFVQVIVYRQYLAILEDVIYISRLLPHYDGQWEWAMGRFCLTHW